MAQHFGISHVRESADTRHNTLLGFFGIIGIWLTAGLALPLVNILDGFTPAQLMIFRGFLTAGIALAVLRGRIGRVDKYTYLIALILPFVTLGLFESIRYWGAGPTIVIIAATPLVNLIIGLFMGRRITRASIIGLVLVFGGIMLARWGGSFEWVGFVWALFATIMNGILYEFFTRAKATSIQKCFYAHLGMGVLGFILGAGASWSAIVEPNVILFVFGFVFVGGFLYWIANLMAFENLPTMEASVLAQGETPAVILGASILLGEHFTFVQWIGVGIALYGTWYLSHWLRKQTIFEKKEI
jgi:drug/metabolite transporter (DMT)-like permease